MDGDNPRTALAIELLTKQVQRLERKVDKLIEKAYRPLWVKASVITGLTGWNNEKMRQARENGYIQYQEKEVEGKKNELWYNLNSLSDKFLKGNNLINEKSS